MTTDTFYSATSDGDIQSIGTDYATTRAAGTLTVQHDATSDLHIAQYFSNPNYRIYETFLNFDTEAPMTPEDFRSIAETSIGGIRFDPEAERATLQRLPDIARRDTFDLLRPSTWQRERHEPARQYQVIIPLNRF